MEVVKVALLSRAVFPLHGYGGLERHVAALEKYLRREGCDVRLYTTPPEVPEIEVQTPREKTAFVPYRLVPWPKKKGFVVVDRDTNYLAWSYRAAKRLLSDERVDVVQADGGAGFGYALLAGPGDPPLVLHPHGMEEFKTSSAKRALYLPLRSAIRFAAKKASKVIAPDAAMKDEVRRLLNVNDDRVTVVPNAVDLEEIDGRATGDLRRFGLPAEAPVVLSVGRLESNKGFGFALRALALARTELPPAFRYVLVGDGPLRPRLESEIQRLALDPVVHLAGKVTDDELHSLYERSDVVLHPTLYEGSSMVTLEAMAHGKAVVATTVGGIPDKVVPQETGLLVPPADPEALKAALLEALRDGARRRRWGQKGRERVEARFSWAERVKEVSSFYREIAGPS